MIPLPNIFFADLPKGVPLGSEMIAEACRALKRNREKHLAPKTTAQMIALLAGLARQWLDPEFAFRKMAISSGPEELGFSPQTISSGLDQFFRQITEPNLRALVEQDLGHPDRLERLVANGTEQAQGRKSQAVAPELILHFAAGNIPNPTLFSMVLGLLCRSSQFVKCATGASLLPRLFAHSLREADPKLAACLEIASWKSGNLELESALYDHIDCATATGGDETVAAIRARIPVRIRFLGFGHRLSFAFIHSSALSGGNFREVVERSARDVSAWDQLGCLSPQVIYVDEGAVVSPRKFAEMLAEELARTEEQTPRGKVSVEVAATIASRRSFYEIRAAHSEETRMWASEKSTAWTVVYEADSLFQGSCLHRFIYVKATPDLEKALQAADRVRGQISTIGLAAAQDKILGLAATLAEWGVTRICPIGEMQNPPITWRHDGRLALADLITWSDWELPV